MHQLTSQSRNTVLTWLSRPLNAALVVFAIALLFRLLVLLAMHDSPYWSHQLVDAKLYDDWAVALTEGDNPHPAPYFYSPVYPRALSIVYRMFGYSLTAARLLQCALGSLLCALVYLLARRLLSHWAAFGAGLVCALFGTLAFYDNLLLKTAPVTFLLFAGVWLLITAEARRSAEIRGENKDKNRKPRRFAAGLKSTPGQRPGASFIRFLLAGVAFGLAADMRGNTVLVAAAVLLFLAIEALRKKRLITPVLFAIGLAASIVPLTLANYAASGEFILTTYSGGFNFYEGNSAEAVGYHPALASVRQTAAHEHRDAVGAAREALGREPSPGEVSDYWFARAWRDIGEDPGRWCGQLALKAALFANQAEIPDNYNYSFMSARLAPLRCNPIGFFLLAPFAIAGLGMAMARGGRWRLTVLIVLVYTGSVVIFYVTARYRVPVVPFLAVLGALAVEQIALWIKRQDFQKALIICVAIFGLFFAVSKPLVPRELGFGREYYALGNMNMEKGDYAGAIENYIDAREHHPASAHIENNLGAAYLRAAEQNKVKRAAYLDLGSTHLRRAVELSPGYFEAWKNLGIALAAAGDTEGGGKALMKAFQLAPGQRQRERIRLMLESISQ